MADLASLLALLDRDADDHSLWRDLAAQLAFEAAVDASGPAQRLCDRGASVAALRWLDLVGDALSERGAEGNAQRAQVLAEKARLLFEEGYDVAAAKLALKTAAVLGPSDRVTEVGAAIAEAEAGAKEFIEKEAKKLSGGAKTKRGAEGEPTNRAIALTRLAETAMRFAPDETRIDDWLRQAVAIAPKLRRAWRALERRAVAKGDAAALAATLQEALAACSEVDERKRLYLALANTYAALGETGRAGESAASILALDPAHPSALAHLSRHYNDEQNWTGLVVLLQAALKVRPGDRLEIALSRQLGEVLWQRVGDLAAAEESFARVRRSDPADAGMLTFFRELFTSRQEAAKFASYLRQAERHVMAKTPPDVASARELALEAARLVESTSPPDAAVEAWKHVVRGDAASAEARAALRRLYETAGKWNALLDVWKEDLDRLPAEATAARVDILQEIAAIYRDRLKLDVMVVNTYVAILKIDPSHQQVMTELADKYRALGRWNDLIAILGKLAELPALTIEARCNVLREMTALWCDRFSNFAQAVRPLERILELLPGDRDALARLKELHLRRRQWKPYLDVLAREVADLTGQEKYDRLLELAKVAADKQGDAALAAATYEQCLAIDGVVASEAMTALASLWERERNWAKLAEVLARQAAVMEPAAQRLACLEKLGATRLEKLGDVEGAAAAYSDMLAIEPQHAKAMRVLRELYTNTRQYERLEALYSSAGQADELVDVLLASADRTEDDGERLRLASRAALLASQSTQGSGDRALRAWERVFAMQNTHREAALALRELYLRVDKWSKLLPVLEALLMSDEPGAPRQARLHEIRALCESRLGSRSLAFGWTVKAIWAMPSDLALLADAMRLAHEPEQVVELLRVLDEAIEKHALPAADRLAIAREQAKLASHRLHDPSLARSYQLRVLALDPADAHAQGQLEELAFSLGDFAGMLALYRQRAERTTDAAAKTELLYRMAALQEERLGNADAAAAIYREIVALDPAALRAFRMLGKLELARKHWRGVIEALDGELAITPASEQAGDLLIRAGRLLETELAAPREAFARYWRAWGLASSTSPKAALLGYLEPFLHVPAKRDALEPAEKLALAEALLPLLEQRRDGERIASALEIIRQETSEPAKRQAIDSRLVTLYGGVLANLDAAWDSARRVVLARPFDREARSVLFELANRQSRHREFAALLAEVLGQVSGEARDGGRDDARGEEPSQGAVALPAVGDLRALASELAHVCEDPLGDLAGAESAWLVVLGVDHDARDAFDALARIFNARERWDDLCHLYNRRIEAVLEDVDRLHTLQALASVEEERRHDGERAIAAYQRMLEIDAESLAAYRALERLLMQVGRFAEVDLLLQREAAYVSAKEQQAILVRRIELRAFRLDDPTGALDLAREALTRNRQEKIARDVVAKLLENPGVKVRAAGILQPIYEAERRYKELVAVLRICADDVAAGTGKSEILCKIAAAEETGLGAPNAAFGSYREALLADPASEMARQAVYRLGAQLGRWSDLAALWQQAAGAMDDADIAGKLRYLEELAALYEKRLEQPARALAVYEGIVALDGAPVSHVRGALLELVRLHEPQAVPTTLAALHHQLANLADSSAGRVTHWQRAAGYERTAGQADRALVTWRYVLSEDPIRRDAYAAIEEMLRETSDWAGLARLLRERLDAGGVGAPPPQLLRQLADLHEHHLDDQDQAIATYQELVEADPDDAKALLDLSRLYEAGGRYFDLLDILERRLEMLRQQNAPEAIVAALGADIATLLSDRLGRDVEALERWAALLGSPSHRERAEAALEALLPRPDLTAAVAEILWPHYRASAQWTRVVRLGETLAANDDVRARIARLGQISRIYEDMLGDRQRAFATRIAALRAAVAEPEIMLEISETERLAGLLGREDALIDLYQDIAPRVIDPEVARRLYLDVAELAIALRQDPALAEANYRNVLANHPDDALVLGALESIYRERDDAAALLTILQRKTELSHTTEPELLRLWTEIALLSATRLGDRAAAMAAWDQVLLINPNNREALVHLGELYAQSERWHDRRDILLRQLAVAKDHHEQVGLCLSLGALARDQLADGEAAIIHFDAALDIDPNNAAAQAALERYLDDPAFCQEAATAVEPRYVARQQWPQLVRVYEIRLQAASGPAERNTLHRQIARLYEEQLEDLEGSATWYARVLRDDPTDIATQGELERLVQILDAWPLLTETYQHILDELSDDSPQVRGYAWALTELYHQRMRDPERALVAARRAFECEDTGEPNDDEILAYLERMLGDAGRHADLAMVYRDVLAGVGSKGEPLPAVYLAVATRLAALYERALGDQEAAIEVYRDSLAVAEDAGDDAAWERAADELQRLLEKRQRWDELVRLLEQRIARLGGDIKESSHRLVLAGLLEQKLGDWSGAVDQYEAVLASSVGQDRAVAALEHLVMQEAPRERILGILEPLYRSYDWWQKLVIILDSKLAYISDVHEQFDTLLEIAHLHEQRGRATEFALTAWDRAWQLDVDSTQAGDAVLRLGKQLRQWPLVVHALYRAKETSSDPDRRALYGAEYALIVETELGDLAGALQAWRGVRDVAPNAEESDRQIERLLLKTGQHAEVAKEWERRALDADGDAREVLLSRLASLYEDVLRDPAGAIRTHEALLDQLPGNAASLDALERLYDATGAYAELARLLVTKLEYADGDEHAPVRRQLRFAIAAVYERRLGDLVVATDYLEQAVKEDPQDHEALAELERLYTQRELWSEVADTLERQVAAQGEGAGNAAGRAQALARAAQLADDKLFDAPRALALYSQALALAPSHAATREALFHKAMGGDDAATAMALLEPLYRQEAQHDKLEAILTKQLTLAREGADGFDVLNATAALARFYEHERKQPDKAYDVWRAALAHDASWTMAVVEIEQLAHVLGHWQQVARDLDRLLMTSLSPEMEYGLAMWLAKIQEEHTGDLAGAARALERALPLASDERLVLGGLERIFSTAQQWPRYVGVLRKQLDYADNDADRADLLYRVGEAEERLLGNLDAAVAAYRDAIVADSRHVPTLQALEQVLARGHGPVVEVVELLLGLYRERNDWPKLYHVLAHRISHASDRNLRADTYHEMFVIAETHMNDPLAALDAAGGWLAESPEADDALAAVERLANQTGRWAELAARLEGLAAASDDPSRRIPLQLRVARLLEEQLGDLGRAEAAYRQVLATDAVNLEALRGVVALCRARGDAASLAQASLQVAAATQDVDERRDSLAQAAAQWQQLGNAAAALDAWTRLLANDDYDFVALRESAALLGQLGRTSERAAMLRRTVDAAPSDGVRLALLEELAAVQQAELADYAGAVATWQERIAMQADVPGLLALEAAQRQAGDRHGVTDTMRQLVEHTQGEARRDGWGRLAAHLVGMEQTDDAAEAYLAALAQHPTWATALQGLASLWQDASYAERLAAVYERAANDSATRGDAASELTFRSQQVDVLIASGHAEAAKTALEAMLARSPGDAQAQLQLARIAAASGDWATVDTLVAPLLSGTLSAPQQAELCALQAQAAEHAGHRDIAKQWYERAVVADATQRAPLKWLYEDALKAGDSAGANAWLLRLLGVEDDAARESLVQSWWSEQRPGVTPTDVAAMVPYVREVARRRPRDSSWSFVVADCEIGAGLLDEAQARLTEVADLAKEQRRNRDYARAKDRLARLAQQRGDVDAAIALFEESLKLQPGEPATMAALATLLFAKRDWENARRIYRALVLQNLDATVGITKGDVYWALGVIHVELGEASKARGMFQRGLEIEPNHERLRTSLAETPASSL